MKLETFDRTFLFRMDNNTRDLLEKQADRCGLNISQYLRGLIKNDAKNPHMPSKNEIIEYKKLVYEINKIGNNINQITKNNNSQLYRQSDKESLEKSMNELLNLLRSYSP